MNDGFQSSLFIPLAMLLAAGLAINLLLYWLVVCRVLYKFGARFPTGVAFWRIPNELKAFRDICSTHGRSLGTYVAFIILFWFNSIMTVIVLLRVLWERTQPPS
jgi:hypothetical protein